MPTQVGLYCYNIEKLTAAAINRNKYSFCIIKSSEPIKNLLSSVNFCQHFFNLSHETVPLRTKQDPFWTQNRKVPKQEDPDFFKKELCDLSGIQT